MQIDIKELSTFHGIPEPELKNKTYGELESLMAGMDAQRRGKLAADPDYTKAVREYLRPFAWLSQWFPETDIVEACALEGMTEPCSTRRFPPT